MSEKKIIVTFVCTGNICRSPMAERLLRHALAGENGVLKDIEVGSAGVAAFDGDAASANAVKALEKCGIDLKDHKSRGLTQEMVEESAVVFGMTQSHMDSLDFGYEKGETEVYLMREFYAEETGEADQIPDPFGGSLETYEICRDAMVEAIPSIVKYLKERYAK